MATTRRPLATGHPEEVDVLHDLITENRTEIIARTRARSAARTKSHPPDIELDRGIPHFLAALSEALERTPHGGIEVNAARHGSDLLRMGFSVSQVVHGYGDVFQAVTELALESGTPIGTEEFRVFNLCLDDAIASAVTEYGRQREESLSRQSTERLGTLAHELRNALSSALLAFSSLKRGVVSVDSSTAALLGRSLTRLRDLVDRSLSEVRLDAGLVELQPVAIFDLVQEVAVAAAAEASQHGVVLRVGPVAARLEVQADRHLLIGALQNVLQNALKFTAHGGHVCLSVKDVEGHVVIDVEDECGGLADVKQHAMFDAFSQHGSDRSGLGLGLSISRASLATFGGTLAVRDVPGKGCVFSMELPKADASGKATHAAPSQQVEA
jgi:signal transduction histidine kinase